MSDSTPMAVTQRANALAPAIIALLVFAASVPLALLVVGMFPLQIGQLPWQFQNYGALLATAPGFPVIIATFYLIGLVSGERLAIRIAAIAAIALAISYVVAVPLFGLAALQLSRQVSLQAKHGFQMESLRRAAVAAASIPFLFWAGVRGLKLTPKPISAGKHGRSKERLIVGQDNEKDEAPLR